MCSLHTVRGCEMCLCGVSMARTSRGVPVRRIIVARQARPAAQLAIYVRAPDVRFGRSIGGERTTYRILLVKQCLELFYFDRLIPVGFGVAGGLFFLLRGVTLLLIYRSSFVNIYNIYNHAFLFSTLLCGRMYVRKMGFSFLFSEHSVVVFDSFLRHVGT